MPDLHRENCSLEARSALLGLARSALISAAKGLALPGIAAAAVASELLEKKACFVTLTLGGALRGCVGHIFPRDPLWRAVMESARNAALHDTRFPAVRVPELPDIQIRISILTLPELVQRASHRDLLDLLRPNEDGVLLQVDGQIATFLPQVWSQIPDKTEFLNRLSEKAGCEPAAWRRPDARVSVYRVESFGEPEARLGRD